MIISYKINYFILLKTTYKEIKSIYFVFMHIFNRNYCF